MAPTNLGLLEGSSQSFAFDHLEGATLLGAAAAAAVEACLQGVAVTSTLQMV